MTRFVRSWHAMLSMVVFALGTACNDASGPDDGAAPTVLRIRSGAPALEQTSVSFYAKRGEARSAFIYFKNTSGGRGNEYLRIEVGANSLVNRPNGTPIAVGDSIQITMQVLDPTRISFELLPSGLQFNAAAPARLITHYTEADPDFNADGRVDSADAAIEQQLANWRRETPAEPYVRLGTTLNLMLKGLATDLSGFTQFIVAY